MPIEIAFQELMFMPLVPAHKSVPDFFLINYEKFGGRLTRYICDLYPMMSESQTCATLSGDSLS